MSLQKSKHFSNKKSIKKKCCQFILAADCKKRWRNIRDTFMKIKRGNKHGRGSTAKPKSKWPLLQQLGFLDNVTSEKR